MANGGEQDDLIGLVYDHATASLDNQRATLDELRSRAGTILGAASIASSFLGGFALGGTTGLDVWAVLAIVAFIAVVGLVLAILWPWKRWRFNFEPRLLIRDYVDREPPITLTKAKRNLAIYAGRYMESNGALMERLWWAYRASIVSLALLIGFWLIGLASRP